MASRFTTVSKDENLAVNDAAVPTNANKETKFGLRRLLVGKNKFLTEFETNHKNDPRNTVICSVSKI